METDPRRTYQLRVAAVLSELRDTHADWTDVTIATQLGISKSAVGQWRAGKALPNPQMMYALADLAGVAPRWLALGAGPKEAPLKTNTLPADVVALAVKIATLPPESVAALRPTFGETVSNERVVVFYPSPPPPPPQS